MEDRSIEALADRYFAALERGDGAAVAACYAPQMRMWHNAFDVTLSGAKHVEALEEWFFRKYADRKYINPRTHIFKGGFVRQHVLTARFVESGAAVHMPICLVCLVEGELLIRVDEYLPLSPPAASDPVMQALK